MDLTLLRFGLGLSIPFFLLITIRPFALAPYLSLSLSLSFSFSLSLFLSLSIYIYIERERERERESKRNANKENALIVLDAIIAEWVLNLKYSNY